jgi:hypothetical protein
VYDGSGWLSSLISLRADLASGDHRALYLGWLLGVQNEELDETDREPAVPAGLGRPGAALRAFADFLRIDRDLIAVAAERSPDLEIDASREEMERWIVALPAAEKDRMLVRLATGEGTHVRAELLRRSRESRGVARSDPVQPRTVAELLGEAADRAQTRRRSEMEKAARARARRAREEAAAREHRLDELARREDEAWSQVEALIEERKAASYDQAVGILSDLQALGSREGRGATAARGPCRAEGLSPRL